MTNDKFICDECETVAHCMKNGCIPKQPVSTLEELYALSREVSAEQQLVDTNCPHCRGMGYDASGYACTCVRDSL